MSFFFLKLRYVYKEIFNVNDQFLRSYMFPLHVSFLITQIYLKTETTYCANCKGLCFLYPAFQKTIKITPSSKDPVFVEANSCLRLDDKSLCLRLLFFIFLGVYVLSSTLNGPCEPRENTYD